LPGRRQIAGGPLDPAPIRSQYHNSYDENPCKGPSIPPLFPESGPTIVIRCPFCLQDNPAGIGVCERCGGILDQPVGSVAATQELQNQVLNLLDEGNKIGAIKWFREHTGAGLKEAKDAVDAIERGSPLPSSREVDEALDRELKGLLEAGQKINAIKRYRERTGVGHKEAKDAVERLQAQLGPPVVGRSGCLGFLVPALLTIMVERVLRMLS